MHQLAADPDRDALLTRLRARNPVFRIEDARPLIDGTMLRLEFRFTCGGETFEPHVTFTGLTSDELARTNTETAERLIRVLAVVESLSYWKAFCSPLIEVAIAPSDPAEIAWWESFWPDAMGEFFYRNGIDFTVPGFLRIAAARGLADQPASQAAPADGNAPPMVMFSGGKDSLALTYAIRDRDQATDFFLYNSTDSQRQLAGLLASGGRIIEVCRAILPRLLALNAEGHPNGHTPYSAYLGAAALLAGYLRGSSMVAAGNSRSDDEPNVAAYHGRPVNHQWTKSHEFEAALSFYRDHWLPCAPIYCSPLRPLYELQIIQSLAPHRDAYFQTASCNRMKGHGWCRECAKCAWVFLATSALFGHDVAVAKIGGDMFASAALSDLFLAMAGLNGDKPFECTGTEDEVRSAIQAAGQEVRESPALAASLASPAVQGARPLEVILKDWGQDDLMPPVLRERVRNAASL